MVALLKANAKAQATISGYHSATGDAATNHELAKTRAMNVEAILVAQGIPESRFILVKREWGYKPRRQDSLEFS